MEQPEYGRRYRSPYSQPRKVASSSRKRNVKKAASSKKRAAPKPAWDDTQHNLGEMKASPQEQVRRNAKRPTRANGTALLLITVGAKAVHDVTAQCTGIL